MLVNGSLKQLSNIMLMHGVIMADFKIAHVFNTTGEDMSAYNRAMAYCKNNGWSVGEIQKGNPSFPVAVFYEKGRTVAKWPYLTFPEIEAVDGFIYSRDYERGNVVLCLRK